MGFSKGKSSICLEDILNKVEESDLLYYYLGISEIPTIIKSPLREDKKPSFGLYSTDGKRVFYIDFATKDKGGILDLLSNMWKCGYTETLEKIYEDIPKFTSGTSLKRLNNSSCNITTVESYNSITDLQCKIREWENYDLEYWESFGISLEWLKYAEVYPISHKIVFKKDNKYVFRTDKYAYAYVEHKEGKVTLKIYQPFNKEGYKWSTNIDRSVWSLWTKIPKTGDNLIITSSLKDSLNIWSNMGIPSICLQGEGYSPKPHIIEELKSRYKNIIVFFDNDFDKEINTGRECSIKLSNQFNLKRIEIPDLYKSKDPSDLFKNYGKQEYIKIMNQILISVI